MSRSSSFRFTLRADEHRAIIYLGEHRLPKPLQLLLRGGRPPREIPIRESENPGFYGVLLNLLQNRGLPLSTVETLPTAAVVDDLTDLTRRDPRKQLALGIGPAGERVELDLISYPHVFIGGSTATGRTVGLETIFAQAVLSERAELWVADPLVVDFSGYPLREQDRYAHRPEELAELLQDLLIEARSRKARLEDESKKSYLELQDPPRAIFLGIAEASYFFGDSERIRGSEAELAEEIHGFLAELLEISAGAGIHVFAESARLRLSEKFEGLIHRFSNRILLGRSDSKTQNLVLGGPSKFSSRLMAPRGRAVLALEGNQELFQGYKVPRELLISEVGNSRNPYSYGKD